jgi:hypothetical protein
MSNKPKSFGFAADGRPIGVECLTPDSINPESFHGVLAEFSLPAINEVESSEWFAAKNGVTSQKP